ncbi:MAG TPA: hypothetical protein ENG01_00265 [Candidatus Aenigmarchaeota archaeon]|nr:MAG: hypothetical protein DRN75_00475 [Nanoarchaeota archaeon]HDO79779.1 hypothetical protein [Candidatus Aenigmarchaeota archaeon]HEX32831.1 hypothetical protein [Candidatus Aenigmarchaeota archaeon]
MTSDKSYAAWYFLLGVIGLYVVLFMLGYDVVTPLKFAGKTLVKLSYVIFIVFAVMAVTNKYITPEWIQRHIVEAHAAKRWIVAVITGILSTGPIYMWYPLLKNLREKGIDYGFIATFLYNRAVKIPMLPVIVYYFGWVYTVILTVVMIFVSVFQGLIIECVERRGYL